MEGDFWQGERVRLRAVEPEDWQPYWEWSHDTEADRRAYHIPFPYAREAARRRAEERATSTPAGDVFRWTIEDRAGAVVGTINSHSCEPRNGTFGYGLGIARAHRGRGYASEAIVIVLRYFFGELRYQKATVHVYSFNAPSMRLHERLGFQLEGRVRRAIYTNGQYFDDIIYGITAEEFWARSPLPPLASPD
jgi:RimJ/RimL family protein N-acetyltransferase